MGGEFPGGGHSNPLQYSCLENPMDREAWWATVPGVTKSDTTEATEQKQEAQKTDQDPVKLVNKPVKSFAQKNDPMLNFKNLLSNTNNMYTFNMS